MTFILVILTLVFVFTIEAIRRSRKRQERTISSLVTEYPTSFDVFDMYFHPGHTWVMVSDRKQVKVGVDDFSTKIIGKVGKIDLPAKGKSIHQGDTLAILHHGSRRLVQVAPVSGKVVEVNRMLRRKPEILNASPMEQGWLVKIHPSNLESDLRNLLKGFAADGWRDAVRAQLVQLFSPTLGPVLQDGGHLIENLGDRFTDREWYRLVQQFFPSVLLNQPQNNLKN